jgi:hypothetical protein
MAKQSGLPTGWALDDDGGSPITFSTDVGTISLDISQAVQDVSGIDVDGTERINLRGDWTAQATGFWEDGGVVVGVFGDIRNARTLTVTYPGRTFTGECIITSFADALGQDGSDGWTASLSSSDGVFPTLS